MRYCNLKYITQQLRAIRAAVRRSKKVHGVNTSSNFVMIWVLSR